MKRLIIGGITVHLTPEDAKITPDDRQELVKTLSYVDGEFVPSTVVVDSGYNESGEVTSYTGVKLKTAGWSTIKGYWTARTLVTVVGIDGVSRNSCRVVVKSWSENKYFDSVTADIEIWRI